MLQVQFLSVSGQSDVEISIIGWTLKYMPSAPTIGWLSTELPGGEFPKMRNFNYRSLKIIACYKSSTWLSLLKPSFKYTSLGRLWSIYQVPRRSHVRGWSYSQVNYIRCKNTNAYRGSDPARFRSKWHWNINCWDAFEVSAKSHDDPTSMDGATGRGIASDAKLGTHDDHEF
jgi:hypothetical protein